jgi:hypothetical protein
MKMTTKKRREREDGKNKDGTEDEMEKELHSTIHSYRHCSTVGNCLTHGRKMNVPWQLVHTIEW